MGGRLVMCILFIAYGYHPRYRLVLLSNRDEHYDRPTTLASLWTPNAEAAREQPNSLFAGSRNLPNQILIVLLLIKKKSST